MNSNRSYKHLKVAHERNFCHFDFFYGAILLPFKKLSKCRSYKFSWIVTLTEVISFRNLYMIKVQKSKVIKIIDNDDRPWYTCVPILTVMSYSSMKFIKKYFRSQRCALTHISPRLNWKNGWCVRLFDQLGSNKQVWDLIHLYITTLWLHNKQSLQFLIYFTIKIINWLGTECTNL